jgi:hypothetical protein
VNCRQRNANDCEILGAFQDFLPLGFLAPAEAFCSSAARCCCGVSKKSHENTRDDNATQRGSTNERMEMEVNLLQNYLLQLLQFARAGRVDGALVKLQKGEGEREGSDEGGGGAVMYVE